MALSIQAVFVPNLANGRVNWSLDSLTVDGAMPSAETTNRLQNAVLSAYQNFWNRRVGRATVTALNVDDTSVAWTVAT